MTELWYSLLLVFATLISSVSQVYLKKSADRTYESIIREYLNPLVVFAYVLFVISAVMTMVAYKIVSISTGAMLETSSYIFVFLFDVFLFRESVNRRKLIAVAMIIIGVAVAVG